MKSRKPVAKPEDPAKASPTLAKKISGTSAEWSVRGSLHFTLGKTRLCNAPHSDAQKLGENKVLVGIVDSRMEDVRVLLQMESGKQWMANACSFGPIKTGAVHASVAQQQRDFNPYVCFLTAKINLTIFSDYEVRLCGIFQHFTAENAQYPLST